jgi:uncharacterized iron-regulated protein
LYQKAYEEAHSVVGTSSQNIIEYSTKFQQSLTKSFRITTQATLIQDIKQNRIVLYGDFHTLRQSQRGLMRILRAYCDKMRTNKVVLTLEMFRARDQWLLDAYLKDQLTDSELLERVNYDRDWGFPWQNFKMLLDFAKARQLVVLGINTDQAGRDDLKTRDQFAANIIATAARQFPGHKIFCLIGEYHLANDHLPKALTQTLRANKIKPELLRIVNNVDHYYFKLQQESVHHLTEYLQLKKNFYCVMNSPPWMKWHSFSLWEEMRYAGAYDAVTSDEDYDADIDFFTEDSFDVDYQLHQFIVNISRFLKLKLDESDLQAYQICHSRDGDFYAALSEYNEQIPGDVDRFIERATMDGVFFIPSTRSILLSQVSVNNLAEAAGQFLHTRASGPEPMDQSLTERFYRHIIRSAVGMIAAKIMNPRRKCMELHNYKRYRSRYKGMRLIGRENERRELAKAVLTFDTWIRKKITAENTAICDPPKDLLEMNFRMSYQLSREIGQMLGYAIYKKVMLNTLPASRLRRLFIKPTRTPNSLWAEVVNFYQAAMTASTTK